MGGGQEVGIEQSSLLPSSKLIFSCLSYTSLPTCLGMALPSVDWAHLYHLAIKVGDSQTLPQANLREAFPQLRIPFFLCVKLKTKISHHRGQKNIKCLENIPSIMPLRISVFEIL